ncbi:hypothetical protein [Actinokineospora sp. NBRC 105648]|uniref:hypothetical protein n=1 Tax=Actinokineospora sp. NBRC 105648 TaxID=3032206 RepID=UPI00249FF25F|nr:hypothetical protein [Actinokineospora sp. NBRC 105648]GLZ41331.1 hypothetical protein Acsp05_49550 [Actinokineospora sp. NBRC 105648]
MRSLLRRAALLSVCAFAFAVPAAADPVALPDADDVVGVGGGQAQPLFDALALAYNGGAPAALLANWDAAGPSPIVPRDGADPIDRPGGTAAGVAELNRAGSTVDFVRRVDSLSVADPGFGVLHLPFASDWVGYVTAPTTNSPGLLLAADLKRVFECTATTWHQLRAGQSGQTIEPVLPRADTGTRRAFLAQINVTTPGACVTEVAENDPAPFAGAPNRIGPFAQSAYKLLPPAKPVRLWDLVRAPLRVYVVVRDTNGGPRGNGGVPAALQPLFGTGIPGPDGTDVGWVCGPQARPAITARGLNQLPVGQCGKAV